MCLRQDNGLTKRTSERLSEKGSIDVWIIVERAYEDGVWRYFSPFMRSVIPLSGEYRSNRKTTKFIVPTSRNCIRHLFTDEYYRNKKRAKTIVPGKHVCLSLIGAKKLLQELKINNYEYRGHYYRTSSKLVIVKCTGKKRDFVAAGLWKALGPKKTVKFIKAAVFTRVTIGEQVKLKKTKKREKQCV